MAVKSSFDWFAAIGNIETDLMRIESIMEKLNEVWKGSDDEDLLTATKALGSLHARLQRKLVEAKHFKSLEEN